MPNHLFICRHADAQLAGSRQNDYDRHLTEKGIIQCHQAALWIKQFSIPIKQIHHSAANRTTQTADSLVQFLNFGSGNIFSHIVL